MTCQDCIHFDVCKEKWEQRFILTQGDKAYMHGVDESCKHFKYKSRMVDLPCEVGQTVYQIRKCTCLKGKLADECLKREKDKRMTYIARINSENSLYGKNICYKIFAIPFRISLFDEVGETVFLTKSEAEDALAKNHQK